MTEKMQFPHNPEDNAVNFGPCGAMIKYTCTETVAAWQWNGPEDNRRVVKEYLIGGSTYYIPTNPHNRMVGIHIYPGAWIIRRGDRYEVITDAEFKAQGWKEAVE